jgi:hypothetical protein
VTAPAIGILIDMALHQSGQRPEESDAFSHLSHESDLGLFRNDELIDIRTTMIYGDVITNQESEALAKIARLALANSTRYRLTY